MFFRKVIKITAEDSPNVKLALAQRAAGQEPSGEMVVEGVLTWQEYLHRRATWDRVRQCVGLDAEFYKGPEEMLFPPLWLQRAAEVARGLATAKRTCKGIGIDPGEGSANTSYCAVDDFGIIELVSFKTPDTTAVVNHGIAFITKHGCRADKVAIDRGGGGKQHADRLRSLGYGVQAVAFGEPPSLPLKRGLHLLEMRKEVTEDRYVFKNRRAEMFGELSLLLDPAANEQGFGIPAPQVSQDAYDRLRFQLSKFPRWYDEEGRMFLPPKSKPSNDQDKEVETLIDRIGYSPDEADSLALACFAAFSKNKRPKAG